MLGLGKDTSGVVGISRNEGGAGTFPDMNVQSNIDDLTKRFRCLEMKLAESTAPRARVDSRTVPLQCYMCSQNGHGMRDCSESKFFIHQDIC